MLYSLFQSQISAIEGIPADDQVLLHAGSPMEDETMLSSYDLTDMATLTVQVRLLGGKLDVLYSYW